MSNMGAARYIIDGSEFIGAFASPTDHNVFVGKNITNGNKKVISETLNVNTVDVTIGGSNLVGIFMRANSKGMLLSNLTTENEIHILKEAKLNMKINILDSPLNAIGNNIMANDSIAFVNSEYDDKSFEVIEKTLGVKAIRFDIGGFKTVGANNILTNIGAVLNNRCSDMELVDFEKLTKIKPTISTANMGSLGIGVSTIANSNGVLMGNNTTGFELDRILDGLNIR